MELGRQRHHHGIDVVASEKLARVNRKAVVLDAKTFGARGIGIGYCVKDAKALQRADVVCAPVAATEDSDTWFGQFRISGRLGRGL
jgi:hypothetical protein